MFTSDQAKDLENLAYPNFPAGNSVIENNIQDANVENKTSGKGFSSMEDALNFNFGQYVSRHTALKMLLQNGNSKHRKLVNQIMMDEHELGEKYRKELLNAVTENANPSITQQSNQLMTNSKTMNELENNYDFVSEATQSESDNPDCDNSNNVIMQKTNMTPEQKKAEIKKLFANKNDPCDANEDLKAQIAICITNKQQHFNKSIGVSATIQVFIEFGYEKPLETLNKFETFLICNDFQTETSKHNETLFKLHSKYYPEWIKQKKYLEYQIAKFIKNIWETIKNYSYQIDKSQIKEEIKNNQILSLYKNPIKIIWEYLTENEEKFGIRMYNSQCVVFKPEPDSIQAINQILSSRQF